MKTRKEYVDVYGEEKGITRWLKGGSLESYIWKHGEEEGKIKYENRMQNIKGKGSLEHYVKKYGNIDGPIKYKEKNSKLSVGFRNLESRFGTEMALQIKKQHSSKSINSLDNFITRHGKKEGLQKYEEYINKNKKSNSKCLEYWLAQGLSKESAKEAISLIQSRNLSFFVKKYGEDKGLINYEKYCKSKGHGVENCIIRFGKEQGKIVYDLWKENRMGMGSLDYYVKKLGVKEGTEQYEKICKLKTLSEQKFIELYGDLGSKLYHEMVIKRTESIRSKASGPEIELAEMIVNHFKNKNVKYGENNFIIGLNIDDSKILGVRCFKPDIVVLEDKVIVEFYGDIFHANPNKFDDLDKPNPWLDKTSLEIRNYDKLREEYFLSKGYKVFIVWESEWKANKELSFKKLLVQIEKGN